MERLFSLTGNRPQHIRIGQRVDTSEGLQTLGTMTVHEDKRNYESWTVRRVDVLRWTTMTVSIKSG